MTPGHPSRSELFSFGADASSGRITFADTSWGRSSSDLQGARTFGSDSGATPTRGISLSDLILGGRPGAGRMEPRAHGVGEADGQEDAQDAQEWSDDDPAEDGDDDSFPSEIVVYPATDDEGEPQVRAAWELWPVPAPRRGRGRAATAARPGQAERGARPDGAVPAAVPRRPLGIHAVPARAAAEGAAPRRPPGIHAAPARAAAAAPRRPPGIHAAPVRAAAAAPRRPPGIHTDPAGAGRGAFADAPARKAAPSRISTLSVRNLPASTSQREFLEEVDRSGFAGRYDFAYLPCDLRDGSSSGHAFVNFRTHEAAAAFAAGWQRSRRFGGAVLNVAVASRQGLQANLSSWTPARVLRIKDPKFLPFPLSGR